MGISLQLQLGLINIPNTAISIIYHSFYIIADDYFFQRTVLIQLLYKPNSQGVN